MDIYNNYNTMVNEHQERLKFYYKTLRALVACFDPLQLTHLDALFLAVQETFIDPKSKCKCVDHVLDGGYTVWRPPHDFMCKNEYVSVKPINFKHCPECGRKLQPHEQR